MSHTLLKCCIRGASSGCQRLAVVATGLGIDETRNADDRAVASVETLVGTRCGLSLPSSFRLCCCAGARHPAPHTAFRGAWVVGGSGEPSREIEKGPLGPGERHGLRGVRREPRAQLSPEVLSDKLGHFNVPYVAEGATAEAPGAKAGLPRPPPVPAPPASGSRSSDEARRAKRGVCKRPRRSARAKRSLFPRLPKEAASGALARNMRCAVASPCCALLLLRGSVRGSAHLVEPNSTYRHISPPRRRVGRSAGTPAEPSWHHGVACARRALVGRNGGLPLASRAPRRPFVSV